MNSFNDYDDILPKTKTLKCHPEIKIWRNFFPATMTG